MIILIIASLLSLVSSFFLTKKLILIFKKIGIVGIDQNKKNKPILPSSGGLAVSLSSIISILIFIGLNTFIFNKLDYIILFPAILSIFLSTFIGFFDDIMVSKKFVKLKFKEKDIRVGLPQWIKPLSTAIAALPLMVTNIGETKVVVPIFGEMDFGIFYPLVLVPLAFIFSSNAVNMLAGFNGMEAGMGIVYLSFLSFIAFKVGSIALPLFLVSLFSLIGYIRFNWYPAKILPGDSLTYFLGSLIAAGVITGNMERAAIIVLIPFLIEFFLKARSKFKASSLGILKNNYLKPKYEKIYSLTHVVMRLGNFNEKQIVLIFILLELLICLPLLF